jgi:hypothetical protein
MMRCGSLAGALGLLNIDAARGFALVEVQPALMGRLEGARVRHCPEYARGEVARRGLEGFEEGVSGRSTSRLVVVDAIVPAVAAVLPTLQGEVKALEVGLVRQGEGETEPSRRRAPSSRQREGRGG